MAQNLKGSPKALGSPSLTGGLRSETKSLSRPNEVNEAFLVSQSDYAGENLTKLEERGDLQKRVWVLMESSLNYSSFWPLWLSGHGQAFVSKIPEVPRTLQTFK